jgi:hypothetical protein
MLNKVSAARALPVSHIPYLLSAPAGANSGIEGQ